MAYGPRNIYQSGRGLPLSADGMPEYKIGGGTLDWTVFPAAPVVDTRQTYDDLLVPANVQFAPGGLIIAVITASGKFGPYESAAADGRQTLTRGECFFMNWSILRTDPHADYAGGGLFDGGSIYQARVKAVVGGVYAALWNSTIAAAFPRARLVK